MRFPRHGLLAQALMMVHLLPELARADAEQSPPEPDPTAEEDARRLAENTARYLASDGPKWAAREQARVDAIRATHNPATCNCRGLYGCGESDMAFEQRVRRGLQPPPSFGDPVCAADLPSNPPFAAAGELRAEVEREVAKLTAGRVDLSVMHAAGAREVAIHDEDGRVLGHVSMGDEPTLSSYNLHVTRPVRTSINGPMITFASPCRYIEPPKAPQPRQLTAEDHRRAELREARKKRRTSEGSQRLHGVAIGREPNPRKARKARRGW